VCVTGKYYLRALLPSVNLYSHLKSLLNQNSCIFNINLILTKNEVFSRWACLHCPREGIKPSLGGIYRHDVIPNFAKIFHVVSVILMRVIEEGA
jgi:hypothetical protein